MSARNELARLQKAAEVSSEAQEAVRQLKQTSPLANPGFNPLATQGGPSPIANPGFDPLARSTPTMLKALQEHLAKEEALMAQLGLTREQFDAISPYEDVQKASQMAYLAVRVHKQTSPTEHPERYNSERERLAALQKHGEKEAELMREYGLTREQFNELYAKAP